MRLPLAAVLTATALLATAPYGAGLDAAVGLVPEALPGRVVLLQLDFGLAQAVSVGPATLLPPRRP